MQLSRSGKPTRKYINGPVQLSSRMLKMISLLVHGHPQDATGTPYDLYSAAKAVGYQKRAGRALSVSPVFLEAYYLELAGKGNAGNVLTLDNARRQTELQRRDRTDREAAPGATKAITQRLVASSAGYVIRSRPRGETGATA